MEDKKLYSIADALLEAYTEKCDEAASAPAPVFSEKFEKKMQNLIKWQKRPVWNFINTAGKRAAVILVVLGVCIAASMSIKAVREPVVQLVIEAYEKFSSIFIQGDNSVGTAPAIIETKYTLGIIPEGYTLTEMDISYTKALYKWINKQEDYIIFSQGILNAQLVIDTEDSQYTKISVGCYEGIYYEKNSLSSIIWHNEDYSFRLICPTSISIDEMIAIAESASPTDS